MKNGFYESRAEQMRSFERDVKRSRKTVREALRSACICGGAEERSRILDILREMGSKEAHEIIDLIIAVPIDKVMGYGGTSAKKIGRTETS